MSNEHTFWMIKDADGVVEASLQMTPLMTLDEVKAYRNEHHPGCTVWMVTERDDQVIEEVRHG